MKKWTLNQIVTSALLIAIHVVLSRFCSINAWNIKIGFAFVPVFVAAYLYGPLTAGIVGAAGDFLGAVLFPIGPYFPGFTVTCFLSGMLFGVLLHKKQGVARILCATGINQMVLGLIVNSFWISVLYSSPYGPLVLTRVVQSLIMIPVEFLGIGFMTKVLSRYRREAMV